MSKTCKIAGCKLAIIPLIAIDEGTRFREDYGSLVELTHSIRTHGIIQPLAVYERPQIEGEEPRQPYVLIAGGRRFRACQDAEVESVPVRIYTKELSELELRTLELAENLYRKDLNWDEAAKLQREIHLLQQQLYGAATPGPSGSNGWSLANTAEMLGVTPSAVSHNIKLAEAAEAIPELTNCKTASEATKLLNNLKEQEIRKELARRAEARSVGSPFIQQLNERYIIKDVLEGLRAQADGTFDMAEIDPPYGIDLIEVKKENDCLAYNEVPQDKYMPFMADVLRETYRTLKPNAWLVCWFGPEPWFEAMYQSIITAGFAGHRMCGIWVKPTGQTMQPNLSLANAYEMFFYARKGSPVLAKPGRTNVYTHAPVSPDKKTHPTERPLSLMQDVLETFTVEGANIIVPFAGSGATLLAAAMSRRAAFGFDLSEEYRDSYILRAQQLYAGM